MSRRAAALALLSVVFLAGAATSLGVLRIVEYQRNAERESLFRTEVRDGRGSRQGGDRPGAERQPRWTELARLRVSDRLSRELGLTDEQRAGMRDAFDRHQRVAQQVWGEVLPVLAEQQDSLDAEIARILTPEQNQRFRRYLTADRDRMRRDPRFGRSRPSGQR